MSKKPIFKKPILLGLLAISGVAVVVTASCGNTTTTRTPATTPMTPTATPPTTPMTPPTTPPTTPMTPPENPMTPPTTPPTTPTTPTNPMTPPTTPTTPTTPMDPTPMPPTTPEVPPTTPVMPPETPMDPPVTNPTPPPTPEIPNNSSVLDDVLNVVNISIEKEKADTTVYEIQNSDIKFSNFDAKKYKITIKKLLKDNNRMILKIDFYVTDLETNKKSSVKSHLETEFKREFDKDLIFEAESKIITVEYPHKEKVGAKGALKSKFKFKNYIEDAFSLRVVTSKLKEGTKTTLVGTYVITNLISKDESKEYSFEIDGFKDADFYDQEQVVENGIKGLSVDVVDKSKKRVSSVMLSDIKVTNYDENKYEIILESFEVFEKDFLLKALLNVKELDTDFVLKKEVIVKGFRNTGLTKVDFDEHSEHIKFDYKNKENLYSWNAKNDSDLIITGYENFVVEVKVLKKTPNRENATLEITYVLKDKKTSSTSEEKTATISGFRSFEEFKKQRDFLTVIASRVKFRANEISLADIKRFGFGNVRIPHDLPSEYEISIIQRQAPATFSYINIKFIIRKKDDINKVTSEPVSASLEGFRA